MKTSHRQTIIYTSLTLLSAFSSVAVFATEVERQVTLQEDVARAELIRLNVSAGEVTITGTSGNTVTAEVTATCQEENKAACQKLLKELDWAKKTGSTTELILAPANINRYNHISVKVKLAVPRDKNLEVSLSAGELNIEGTSACVTAEVNAGEINITLPEKQLASASLSTGVGDVNLKTAKGESMSGERSLLVGAKLDWKGNGICHAKVSVLTGEANLVLQ